MQFSAGRTRLRREIAHSPGVTVSRPWPPPGFTPRSARQTRRWDETQSVTQSETQSETQQLPTPPSPRSARSICSARDPRGTGTVQVPRATEKPAWGVLEWGQSRLFYPGGASNPAQPPTTLPSGASMCFLQSRHSFAARYSRRITSFIDYHHSLLKSLLQLQSQSLILQ